MHQVAAIQSIHTMVQAVLYFLVIVMLFINRVCRNTPVKASRYCAQHNRTAATTYQDDLQDEKKSTTNEDNPGSLIVKITNNKTTRQGHIMR